MEKSLWYGQFFNASHHEQAKRIAQRDLWAVRVVFLRFLRAEPVKRRDEL